MTYYCMKCKGETKPVMKETPFFAAAKLQTQRCDKCDLNFFILRDDR